MSDPRPQYVLNPTLQVSERNVRWTRWTARRRNRSLTAFGFERLPSALQAWLRDLLGLEPVGDESELDVDDDVFASARDLGIIITPDEIPDPPFAYWCADSDPTRLVLAPDVDIPAATKYQCFFQTGSEPPEAIRSRVRTGADLLTHLPHVSPLGPLEFDKRTPVLWIEGPLGLLEPIWSDAHVVDEMQAFLAGTTTQVSEAVRRLISLARIGERDTSLVSAAREHFAKHGYAVLRDVVSPLTLAALRSYYNRLSDCGFFEEEPKDRRAGVYCDVVGLYWQHQLAEVIGAIVDEDVKPSYTWVRRYFNGAVLDRHTDRPQCRWNVSFCIDLHGDQTPQAWPFFLETQDGVHEINHRVGDAVIYSGTDTPHWRNRLEDRHMTVYLFHYVAEQFSGFLG